MADLKDKQWYDETGVANSRAGTATPLLWHNVRRTDQDDGEYHGIDHSNESNTHHDPQRNKHDLQPPPPPSTHIDYVVPKGSK